MTPDKFLIAFVEMVIQKDLQEALGYVDKLVPLFYKHTNYIERHLRTSLPLIDVCGTGGDKLNTLNISTAVSMLVARSGQFSVAKHGGRASSSKCGSFDVIEKLGYKIPDNVDDAFQELKDKKLVFLYAPYFNPLFEYFAPLRKQYNRATIFNLIAPLLNPIELDYQFIGVSGVKCEEYLKVAFSTGKPNKTLMVVEAENGMDAISTVCASRVCCYRLNSRQLSRNVLPQDFGIKKRDLAEIQGGDVDYNATKLKELFDNPNANPAYAEIVCLNTAFVFLLADLVNDPQDGYELAKRLLGFNVL